MSFPTITNPSNERIKRAIRLRRGTHRRDEGRTLIDGFRELSAAAAAGVVLDVVYFCPDLLSEEQRPLLNDLASHGTTVLAITQSVLERLAFGERAEGIVAVATVPQRSLADLECPESALIAVLEGVEKPGNLGAVVRSADAAGVSAVIAADADTDLFNPNAIRASLGTIFRVPVCAAAASDTLAWLKQHHLQIVATRLDGDRLPWQVDLTRPTAIVLGAEATGLSPIWSSADVVGVRLPMLGGADSLNVSATAAVMFFEAVRQRQQAD